MRNSYKVLTAVAVAGLALAGGSAFTGTGVTTTGTAASAQFVGGTVSQSVTGATLSSIVYGFDDATAKTRVNTITLNFTDAADGLLVGVAPSSDSTGVGSFACLPVAGLVSTCSYTAGSDALNGYTGLKSLAVTVTSP